MDKPSFAKLGCREIGRGLLWNVKKEVVIFDDAAAWGIQGDGGSFASTTTKSGP